MLWGTTSSLPVNLSWWNKPVGFTYGDDEIIKIDFKEYDYPQIEQGVAFGKLRIDSTYDIAINKLYTLFSRHKARDYVDLYMLITRGEFSLEQLFGRIPDKFGPLPTDLTIIRSLMAAQDVVDYPVMLVPFGLRPRSRRSKSDSGSPSSRNRAITSGAFIGSLSTRSGKSTRFTFRSVAARFSH